MMVITTHLTKINLVAIYRKSISNLSSGVINISLAGSFAALKDDGSVVTWGDGLTMILPAQISSGSGIVDIFTNKTSFAGLKDDGSVITWER